MRQYSKSRKLKDRAKDSLRGKYRAAVSLYLLSTLISYSAGLLADMIVYPLLPRVNLSEGFSAALLIPGYLITGVSSFLLSLVTGVLQLGMALFFLNIACGRQASVQDLFYGFRQNTSKAFTISAVHALLNLVCFLPGQLLLDSWRLTGDTVWLLRAAAVFAAGCAVYLPISLGLGLSFYLMLDFPDKSAQEILALSFRVMQGQKRRLFYIKCSFLPLLLLSQLSLYVGYLWVEPYMNMTLANFFLDVMSPEETNA